MKKVGRKFWALWVAQIISLLGSHMSSFALGISFFKETQSIFIYSLFPLFTILPEVLLAPILGVFVDRWNRKKAMIIGHLGAGICMLLVILSVYIGNSNIYIILPLIAISSVFNGFMFPAFIATTSQIVSKNELSKASAILQFGFALVFIISPALAGSLLSSLGINFIFLIDVVSFSLAIIIVLRIKIDPIKSDEKERSSFKSFKNELKESISYIKKEPLLVFTLIIIAIANFNTGIINVLITPLVLGVSDSSVLGIVLSIAGLGFLIGSIVLMIIGDIKGRVTVLLMLGVIQGIVFLLVCFSTSLILVEVGAFVFMICMGLIGGLNMVIWQQKVPQEMQGRVFSIRTLVLGTMMLFGFLSSGQLTENVFLPLINRKSFFNPFFADLIGKSPYPEIEALLLVLGLGTIISLISIYIIMRFCYRQVLVK